MWRNHTKLLSARLMSEFYVPIDAAIVDFSKHLNANPRTFLSSKFGDGKSFFLQKMKEEQGLNNEYEFLTIYPVNYQVVGNQDIFELIKRDILFQLMLHGMISNSVILKESEAFSWFVYMNGKSLVSDLLPYIAELGLEPEESATVLSAMKELKLFKRAKEQFNKFKNEQLATDDDRIDAFLEKTDSHYLYDCDAITKIIQKAIKDYQRRTHKKVALIVEDLDRIDPAHLFRVLNVLSAHIDYGYKYFVKPDASLVGNKFGLDNIVLVIDYNNLRQIYKHFYGERTDFNGYISKFLSSVPFYYSLEKQSYEYVVNKLSELTELNEDVIKLVFSTDLLIGKTIREIVQSFDIATSIIGSPIVKIDGRPVALNTSFVRVMAIFRRLKYTNYEIKQRLLELKAIKQELFVRYVLPYAFLCEKNVSGNACRICINNEDRRAHQVLLRLNKEIGIVSIESRWMRQGHEVESNFSEYIEKMFGYIA